MYDPHALLQQIDAHKLPILLICSLSMAANYTLFIESFRQSRARRMVTMPVFCTVFWLVHDLSFVLKFDKWFNDYDHWYLKLFWVALLLTVAWEIAFTTQIVRYGREELAPFLSQAQFAAAVIVTEAVAMGVWLVIKNSLDDDLYVLTFGVALIAYPIFGIATMARRRSVEGFTPLQPAALTVMCATWYTATIGWFGAPFHGWAWITLAILCTGSAAVMWALAVRFRAPASVDGLRSGRGEDAPDDLGEAVGDVALA